MDLSTYTVDELKALRDSATDELKARHAGTLEAARALKAERAEKYAGNVNTGDTISFLYNRENREGVVTRANEKSVTIVFEDGKKHYISYENVVEILDRAPVEAETDEEETEETEEVAQ